jgi:hypothetical protein
MSKSSAGSSHSAVNSFVHKLANQQKLASAQTTTTATPAAVLSNIMKQNFVMASQNAEMAGISGMGGRSGSTGITSKNITSVLTSQRENTSTSNLVQAPKVISNNFKQPVQTRFDYSSIQALMSNLKMQTNSQNAIQINGQKQH